MTLMEWATDVPQRFLQREAKMEVRANPQKKLLSTDKNLELDSLKKELLVIVHQQGTVKQNICDVLTTRQAQKSSRNIKFQTSIS